MKLQMSLNSENVQAKGGHYFEAQLVQTDSGICPDQSERRVLSSLTDPT